MSGQIWGADTDELDAMARSFGDAAQHLRRIETMVRAGVNTSPWSGHSADRFRADWSSRHARVLLAAADAVDGAGRAVAQNADQQRAASAASGPSGGSAPGGNQVGPAGVLSFLSGLWAVVNGGKKAISVGMRTLNYGRWVSAMGRAVTTIPYLGFETAEHSAAWARFILANKDAEAQMAKFINGDAALPGKVANLLGKVGADEALLGKLSAAKGIVGKVALPLTVVTGVTDAITGGGDHGWHGAATRVAGGVGAIGAGALLASSAGLIALGPIGLGIAGAAVVGYGLYSVGNLIYNNREAIGHALSTGWNATSHAVGNVASGVASGVGNAVAAGSQAAHNVLKTLTHPLSILPALHVF